ncbi:Syd family protein [Psychromonas sp. CNPT3]|uniref:SecY-interacting protein n=1 Tax=Psychromonas sp. CNPT3 TaxID=314282 RepID=UPI00006E9139|nr:SecY-interacting protein [Psychromonas sp. CNPT3]AGH81850.1 Syd family protein [Psychromonas sp. CNPT3]
MNNAIQTELLSVFSRYASLFQTEKESYPLQPVDKDWLSPCLFGDEVQGEKQWKSVVRTAPVDLSNIESALEITLHPSIHAFFCSVYSAGIPCLFESHPIELIQVWNEEDFQLLQENMIAHFMMQKKLGKPASMFIGTCSDEMQIISIANDSGEIQLETLGKGRDRLLADDLGCFLQALRPIMPE